MSETSRPESAAPSGATPSDAAPSGGTDVRVIAIDGPSGSGKSSVARAVANQLGFGYLDTGAMYRALTWWLLDEGVDLADADAVARRTPQLPLSLDAAPDGTVVRVGETDVSETIRTTEISSRVSQVATVIPVREWMKDEQRRRIDEIVAHRGGCVAEGRDITTVVAPDADVRILLTASEEARLRRRSAEVHGATDAQAIAATRDQIVRRDAQDSTVSQFTVAADGVTTLDTSDLDLPGSIAAVLTLVEESHA